MNEQVITPTVSPVKSAPITITINSGEELASTKSSPKQTQIDKKTSKQKDDGVGKAKDVSNIEKTDDVKSKSVKDLIPSVPFYQDPLFYEVANYFGLKQEDYDSAKNKLSDIVEYVIRELESNKIEDVLPKIREIESSISSPGWEERRYANVHKYIRLADKKQTISKIMKTYEKKPGNV